MLAGKKMIERGKERKKKGETEKRKGTERGEPGNLTAKPQKGLKDKEVCLIEGDRRKEATTHLRGEAG